MSFNNSVGGAGHFRRPALSVQNEELIRRTSMNATRGFILFQLAMVVLVALCGRAFSSTIGVGSCASGIVAPTIQQAVNASSAAHTVTVCPGTYREQVLLHHTITLVGRTSPNPHAH